MVVAAAFVLRSRGINILSRAGSGETTELLMSRLGSIEKNLASSEGRLTSSISTAQNALASHLVNQQSKSHETLTSLSVRLQTLNETSKRLQNLTEHVDDLKRTLASPRARGFLGEQRLEDLVTDSLPPSSYTFQGSLEHPADGSLVRPDCLLTLPEPIGTIAVDAKFPLDSFRELLAARSTETTTLRAAQTEARKKFKTHVTKHIRDVASKYVIPPVTSAHSGAILFIPSEAVFSEVVSYHADLLKLAHSLNVWLCSPTTLMAVLTTMRGVTRDLSIQQKSEFLVKELNLFLKDADAIVERAAKVEKQFENAKESLRLLGVSTEKVRRRGLSLRNLESGMKEDENDEEKEQATINSQ